MDFILNEYHSNVSDDLLIDDLKETAKKLGKETLTVKEYDLTGKYHSSTMIRRFGGWINTCKKAGFTLGEKQFSNSKEIDSNDFIEDLRFVADKLNKNTVTREEYKKNGKYYATAIEKRFNGWTNALENAQLNINCDRDISNESLFDEIENIWIKLGRQPTTKDIKNGISKYALNTYSRRFGGWRNSLISFLKYIDSPEKTIRSESKISKNDDQNINDKDQKHKTPRDVNLRLRFLVLKRDNFSCKICGASPAKDPSVVLHIDHIIPWSKGGETVIDNLQTLCEKCNLGKSNIE
jgi:5-methylcytosine-specific restriction endonuclease McrA